MAALRQVELLHVDGVHDDEVPVRAVPGRRGGADEALQACVVGQGDRVAGKSAAAAVADTGGQVGHRRGQVGHRPVPEPDPVGASGSYIVTAKLRVVSGNPDQLSCGETSEPPAPMMPLT